MKQTRNLSGTFGLKGDQMRHTRSIRLTDRTWTLLQHTSKVNGFGGIADYLEDWASSQPDPTVETTQNEPTFPIRLWIAFEVIARSEVGDSLYGHPVRLKAICNRLSMGWDDFLTQLASVADSDGSLELIPLRGQNYQVGDRRVAALTYHS